MAEWNQAVSSTNAAALTDLVISSAPSPEQALSLLQDCVAMCNTRVAVLLQPTTGGGSAVGEGLGVVQRKIM